MGGARNCKLQNGNRLNLSICNVQCAICNRGSDNRRGGVYIAVLGAALVISLLGITALIGQRIQSRIVMAASDIRQAQLNAATAVELGLLKIKTDSNWRSQLDAQSYLIKNRGLAAGVSTCSLQVFDAPTDAVEVADKPLRLVAIGRRGPTTGDAPRITAEQRMELVIEPRRKPHDCLKPGNTAVPNWATVFQYYGTNGTQIPVTSLPDRAKKYDVTIDNRSFCRNPSVTSNDSYWFRADDVAPSSSEFTSSNVTRRENTLNHQACMEVERSNRKGGFANRLRGLLKPNTQYRFDVQLHPEIIAVLTVPNSYKAFLVVQTGGTIQVIHGSTASIPGGLAPDWFDRTFYVTTPAWATEPNNVYFAINSDTTGGNISDFHVDNIDAYETGARFIHQTVLGPNVNPFGTANSSGIYWIDCQNTTKLVIERSRILGTLLILNPGPGSCIDYGPIHMSPAVPGYPALLVSNAGGNNFAIQATPDPTADVADNDLTESENGVNFNPSGVPHKTLGTDTDESDTYDSELYGLVVVSGNLTYANSPAIRGRVVVGGTVSGSPTFEYRPDALLNPPPPVGGFFSYRLDRRPASVRKNVLP
jgi:hypothetical protein